MRFSLKTTLAATAFAVAGTAALAQEQTIVDIAAANPDFAPTDDAVAARPEGTLEGLLKPEAKGDLTNVLLYHVVPGKVMSGDIAIGKTAVGTALEGAEICVILDGGVMLDDGTGSMATVTTADIEASNGVIHVIDKVVLPGNAPNCM